MNNKCIISLKSILLMIMGSVALLSAGSIRGEAYLVKDGKPCADIVISDKPARAVKLASAELQTYIEKISGAKLAITNTPGADVPAHIYVGRSAETDKIKISDEGLKGGAFRMVSGKDYLVLLGHDKDCTPDQYDSHTPDPAANQRALPAWDERTGEHWGNPSPGRGRYSPKVDLWEFDERGTLNAVYEFLRGLGVRWYMPGDLGEVVPELKTISLAPVDKTVKPDFPYRNLGDYSPGFNTGSRNGMLYKLRCGFDATLGIPGPHGLCNVFCRDEFKKAHPGYFALCKDGQRSTAHTCLSSPEFFDNTVKYARTVFDIYPDLKSLSLWPNDGFYIGSVCQCDLCQGKCTLERGVEGHISDYVWDFVERVARELYKTHPDRKVICGSYGSYALPPEKIAKFSPNVMVGIVQTRYDFNNPETHAKTMEIRKGWLAKLAPGNLYIYCHYLDSGSHLPSYYPHVIAEDLHSLKGLSQGEFIELSWADIDNRGKSKSEQVPVPAARQGDMHAPGFNHLNVYVTGRYYWDADQDIEALLNEYYEKFYGPAAKEMKAFIDYSEENWSLMRTKVEQIDKALALLAAARKAAGDTVYGKRVDLLVEYLQPMKPLRDKLVTRMKDVPQAVTVERKSADLKLDGKLDEAFWKDVPVYELKDNVSGQPPTNKTTFQVVWGDDETIIFGIRCQDSDMKNLNITSKKNDDFGMWPCDVVEILLETQEHSHYQIAINPVGALADIDWTDKGKNLEWSSCAESAAYIGDTFWSVELRIPTFDWTKMGRDPLKKVEGKKPVDTAPWFFNVCRERVRGEATENSAFSPTGGSFHVPMKFGVLIVK